MRVRVTGDAAGIHDGVEQVALTGSGVTITAVKPTQTDAHGHVSPADEELIVTLTASGGGSVLGAARVLGPFPFLFDHAGLNNGLAFYTPTLGDLLLDAWIEIGTRWNTATYADIGSFVGVSTGFFNIIANANQSPSIAPVDLRNQDDAGWLGTMLSGNTLNSLSGVMAGVNAGSGGLLAAGGVSTPPEIRLDVGNANPFNAGDRFFPAKFTTADPLLVVASQTGLKGGTVSASTAGAGAVYLVIATPSLT